MTGFLRIGPYFVPPRPAAARLYWRCVHRPQRRRGALLARLAAVWPAPALPRRPRADLPWAAAVEARLREPLGTGWHCVWRAPAPGVSRAALGWIGRRGRVLALARVAFGDARGFLRREARALEFLAAHPGLADSTPRRLWIAEDADALYLLESACRGGPAARASLGRRDWLAAAAWLARFQRLTPHAAPDGRATWREPLQSAILAHPGLRPAIRERLLRRLEAIAAPRLAAAHGDFWWGNVLHGPRGQVSVVDWTEFRACEHPLHDAAFFLLTLGRDLQPPLRAADPGCWLEHAFAPGAAFRARARRWFDLYRRLCGGTAEFDDLLAYLPIAMARYACFGQQAEAWTAACNSGAWL